MEPASPALVPRSGATHCELLRRILACATRGSAAFANADNAICQVTGAAQSRALARELLTDLAIRGWIALCRQQRDGSDALIAWRRYELELSDERNWVDARAGDNGVRYALTERGRDKIIELLGPAGWSLQPTAPDGARTPGSTTEPNRARVGGRSVRGPNQRATIWRSRCS